MSSILYVIEKWDDARKRFVPTGNARRTYKAASDLLPVLDKKLPGQVRQIGRYVRAQEMGKKRK